MGLMVGVRRFLLLCIVLLVLPVVAAFADQTINATVRDFPIAHPDFEGGVSGLVTGLVGSPLPADKKPAFVATPGAGAITDASTFAQWYTDVPGINRSTTLPLTLTETAPGSGIFDLNDPDFFPVDGVLFGNEGLAHNYHFTLELHTTFTYQPGQTFHFTGDDDMWVYINNQLVVDLGGVHAPASASVALDTLGLTPGNTYNFDLYFAERHTVLSSFHIQTSIAFTPHPTIRDPRGSNAQQVYPTEIPQGLAPNLIVLVHGCCTDANDLGDWNEFRSSIQNTITTNQTPGPWEIVVWDWTSGTPKHNYIVEGITKGIAEAILLFTDDAFTAYNNAFDQGYRRLGRLIANHLSYKYVHFIGHSAGSNLIQNAIDKIRATRKGNDPIIHATFLDAFAPYGSENIYGAGAQYAEQNVDLRPLPYTDATLFFAYNFNVTGLDPSPDDPLEALLGHRWPIDWYKQSIGSPTEHSFGFPLSFEGYNGSFLKSLFEGLFPGLGNDPPAHYSELKNLFRNPLEINRGGMCTLIDNISLACSSHPDTLRRIADYSRLIGSWITGEIRKSITGVVETIDDSIRGWLATLSTGSPVWLEAPITTPEPFNLIKFDYQFLSAAGSQGILTVFVDDQLVYKIDERITDPGINTTQDIPVGHLSPGQHTLGFRLDPFTAVQSVARISSIQLGLLQQVEPSVTDSELNQWCISHGADEVRLINETVYGWACYKDGASSPPGINMLEFCQDKYPGQNYVNFHGDFYDPLSWECFGPVGLLGGLNLPQYCVDHGFANVSLTGSTVDDWSCIASDSRSQRIRTDYAGELSMTQACREQYTLPIVRARVANYFDATSVQCWGS
jgi:fibro-slime domain-containing protein